MTIQKFSVVIPCFNDGLKIRHGLESCLLQTLPAHEIIIVDDGSSDLFTIEELKKIAAAYKDKGVTVFFLDKNRGVSAARNKGMDLATGDFICFLDSDDVWHPDKLKVVNAIIDKTNDHFCFSHDYVYDYTELPGHNYYDVGKIQYKEISFNFLLIRNPIATPSLVVPAKLNLRFEETLRYAEDHEFILRLSRVTKVLYLEAKLLFVSRRIGSKGGLSGNLWKMRKGEIKMYFLLCKSDPKFYLLLPFMILYSLAKHIRVILQKASPLKQ